MRIIRRHLLRAIVTTTLLVLGVLLSLGAFIQFMSQLDDLGVGGYGVPQAMAWVMLKMPNVIFQMLPIAVLLGALLGLGTLASRSEFVVLQAAGVSPRDMARAVLVTGLLLALVAALLGEYVAPPLERYARQFRAMAKYGQVGLDAGESAWIRDRSLLLNVLAPTDDRPGGSVYVFRLNDNGSIAAIGRADSVSVEAGDRWMLENFSESRFGEDAVTTLHMAKSPALEGVNPDLLGLTVVRQETLSGVALYRYFKYLKRNGLDARHYELAFWSRIGTAVAVALMCVLAVPFVTGPLRSTGAGARLLLGLGIGLVWFLVSRTLADSGEIWNLNLTLMALLPTAFLAVVTAGIIARAR